MTTEPPAPANVIQFPAQPAMTDEEVEKQNAADEVASAAAQDAQDAEDAAKAAAAEAQDVAAADADIDNKNAGDNDANAAEQAPAGPAPTLLKEARITVTTDAERKEYSCLRNLNEIKQFIEANFLSAKEVIKSIKIELGFTDGQYQILAEGTYDGVVKFLDENIINAATAMEMVKHLCIRLVETSDMKCAMITLIFDGARVGGVGIHNDTLPIEPMEIKAFLNAAAGQLDMYTRQIAKKYPLLGAPSKGRIILP